ncbi:hypothetical protein JI721_04125 [Alicyclobacillus cycloheptanicus]|uniref:DUF4367 domain-containing protein n=1 Tax=Alicyclobacillus cycloheptanicus TaxID=1457 RepID=A0ABT9XN69_9BACL|nr:hypothetical protein [Alicyclobacillus cycloheptanicus]MDQ0191178.1 hypothetical protein [Alicyclobacillus cycloheptanicus]WDM02024.1 hypothetical protein JI721_04125 [Alicyclobacillus cycloheptanicus]
MYERITNMLKNSERATLSAQARARIQASLEREMRTLTRHPKRRRSILPNLTAGVAAVIILGALAGYGYQSMHHEHPEVSKSTGAGFGQPPTSVYPFVLPQPQWVLPGYTMTQPTAHEGTGNPFIVFYEQNGPKNVYKISESPAPNNALPRGAGPVSLFVPYHDSTDTISQFQYNGVTVGKFEDIQLPRMLEYQFICHNVWFDISTQGGSQQDDMKLIDSLIHHVYTKPLSQIPVEKPRT